MQNSKLRPMKPISEIHDKYLLRVSLAISMRVKAGLMTETQAAMAYDSVKDDVLEAEAEGGTVRGALHERGTEYENPVESE